MHNRFFPGAAGVCLVAALSSLSCELLPVTVRVALDLPPQPEVWREAWGTMSYEVTWTAAGNLETVPGFASPGSRVTVDIPRSSPVAIRAVPVWDVPESGSEPGLGGGPALAAGETVAVAGALWLVGAGATRVRGDSLALSFRDGPAAEIVHRLHGAGVDLRGFNAARLVVEIRDRLADDPWSIDVERVVQAVGLRSMRASHIRAPELHDTGLVAPPGRWLPVSPFSAATSGGERWPPLPAGVSRFYSQDGRRWVVHVDAEGRGWQPGGRP